MPDIPIRISAQGMQAFDRIATGFKKIEQAGGSAVMRVRNALGLPGPSPGGHRPAPGPRPHGGHPNVQHGGFWGSVHAAGRAVGGEFGHIAHRASGFSALSGMGGLAIGLAGAGAALTVFNAAIERSAEKVRAIFEETEKIVSAQVQGYRSQGQSGLAAMGDQGGLRQLLNQGSYGLFLEAKRKGFAGNAESFAGLGITAKGGPNNRLDAALVAQRLGVNGDQAAKMAAQLGTGVDAEKGGRFIAERSLGRRITDEEYQRSQRLKGKGLTGTLDRIRGVQGNENITALSFLQNGQAEAAARGQAAETASPFAAAMTKLQYAQDKNVEMLNTMHEQVGFFGEFVKTLGGLVGGEGSFLDQGRRAQITHGAAVDAASQ